MADLLSMVMDLFSMEEPSEVLGHRIQKSLQVILAGLDERDTLSGEDIETLRRELRMLLELNASRSQPPRWTRPSWCCSTCSGRASRSA